MARASDLRATLATLTKSAILHHLRVLLHGKLSTLHSEIESTRAAFVSDTKSSAGDKHEVGRAMVQQELDKLEDQKAKLIALQHELARVPLDRVHEKAGFGSLVITDGGSYFIAIGLGAVTVDGETCFAVSLASPIGQLLNERLPGERILFNGREIAINAIS
jgi:hypothetical protein